MLLQCQIQVIYEYKTIQMTNEDLDNTVIIVLRLSGPKSAFTVLRCLSGQGDNTSFQRTAATIASYHWAPVSQFTGDWILPSRKLVPGFEPGIYTDCTVKFIIAQFRLWEDSNPGPQIPSLERYHRATELRLVM